VSQFTFRTTGGDRRRLERELAQRGIQPRPEGVVARVLQWARRSPLHTVACTVGVLALVSSIHPPTPDERVIARNLLVFTDTSGSMVGTEASMASELDALKAYGVEMSAAIGGPGFGVRHDKPENFLARLRTAVNGSTADAVYLVSDFDVMNDEVDTDNAEGLTELRQILRDRRMRLYLRTVRYRPSPGMLGVARESGGDYIGP
jgi:hypothetical protein